MRSLYTKWVQLIQDQSSMLDPDIWMTRGIITMVGVPTIHNTFNSAQNTGRQVLVLLEGWIML